MATRKILGLDLGVGSIGWALILEEDNTPKSILAMGSRIIPMDNDDATKFQKGQTISKSADRTARRTARKGYDRYQMRRAKLTDILRKNGMLPEHMDENCLDLWRLRSDAATEGIQLTLPQLGRVLYHINQKRGYKHAKSDSADSKQTKYVEAVNQRFVEIQQEKKTIGQHFYSKLLETVVHTPQGDYFTYRIKDQVFPRAAYMQEFDQIMRTQRQFYPEILTDDLIDILRNRIIFYQRPLKSCKHLVGLCEFEMRPYQNTNGQIVYNGPKCAPRTSPLAQLCALWETVNNISLTNRHYETYEFTLDERRKMVDFLWRKEKMTSKNVQDLLELSAKDWYFGKALGKGIKGNTTYLQLSNALAGKYDSLLQFNLIIKNEWLDPSTGELLPIVSSEIEKEPLYKLWHIVYSVQDKEDLKKALYKQFKIDDENVVDNLYKIDFVKPGYANKSHKFIRKILPYLMKGDQYSVACQYVGINHSNSKTKQEIEQRLLLDRLPLLEKNELRQPIIEKILNQMINIVNALKAEYGDIDEVRVELARELKQSKDERDSTYKRNKENENKNKEIEKEIAKHGVRPSRARIQKYKLWTESNRQCFYCGAMVGITEFLNGADVEIEHIIPKSVLFDDSYSNKVCACRKCNAAKGNRTAREFMEAQTEAEYRAYLERVEEAFKREEKPISKTKHDHLLWRTEDIPQDFIDRQLRQSQYIAKKAVEILQQGFRYVYTTSGSVTDFLRHQWGYDSILESLNLPRYEKVEGLTELRTYEHRGQEHTELHIKNWSKRMDHRHHAVDALTIALTSQGMIQRLNTLNASRQLMFDEVGKYVESTEYKEKRTLLENWVSIQKHFSVQEVKDKVDGILISFRAGKRVTTPATRAIYRHGKRIVVQNGLLVPRGALSEETVYGKIEDRFVVKYTLNHPSMRVDDIVDPTIRDIVRARLNAYGGKAKNAFAEPIYSDKAQQMQIRSVRCYTGLKESAVRAVRFDTQGKPIGFVKTGNNHHVAIYRDANGNLQENIVTFWEAVERKRYHLPVVIENPKEVWNQLIDSDLPQSFLENLPKDNWQFVVSLQQNEMFILGMEDADFEMAIENKDYPLLNKYLYRVQKIASKDYYFRYHVETTIDDKYDGQTNMKVSMVLKKMKRIKSLSAFSSLHPHKVRINLLGEISVV